VVQRFQYGPYGDLLKGDASQTPFLFNGKYGVMTDGNGLYYMRARFYSPEIKRFVNMDVLVGRVSQGQTLNRYTYVTGRPVSYIDPFGLLEMRDEYGEPTASNDDIMPDVEDVKWLLAISSFFTPGPGELLDIDVLFGITQSSTGWEKLGATSSLVLSALTLGASLNYGSVVRCTAGIPFIGHTTRWADMIESQRRAFKHSYSRHGKDFGLPNWQETKAEELRQLFNQAVGQVPEKGTYLGVRRKPHNGVSVETHYYEADINGIRYYYYETLSGQFISAGKVTP
jgi:RHS repeat-associated protein